MLGIDPGMRCTGLGAVVAEGSRVRVLDWRLVRPRASSTEGRLAELARAVREAVARHAPDRIAIEDGFVAKNARTALALGEARGAILAACAEAGVPVVRFAPGALKLALVGHGGATKAQVQFMVRALLRLDTTPPPDAADALAAAICAVHHRTMEPSR